MTLYLLNSPVLTDHGLWRFSPLEASRARELASGGFVSAIGHEATARLLAEVLGVEVPVARIRASLAPGDAAIVLRLRERLPEGTVLDAAALRALPWELSLMERLE
ncbi:MAG TPA: DUF1874 domain-containing protein [Gammaproteobacteria bacterium]|nr:DUF1874 domain-containing protein [Gammaproteobacteria bacterium]